MGVKQQREEFRLHTHTQTHTQRRPNYDNILKTYFNIILPSTLRSRKWPFNEDFPTRIALHFRRRRRQKQQQQLLLLLLLQSPPPQSQ